MEVVQVHNQYIHARVSPINGDPPWCATAVYGSPCLAARDELWLALRELTTSVTEPWVKLGDFNAYLSGAEKNGRVDPNVGSMHKFQSCVDDCQFIDVGYNVGRPRG